MRFAKSHVRVKSARTRDALGTLRVPLEAFSGVPSEVGGGWGFPTQGGGVA